MRNTNVRRAFEGSSACAWIPKSVGLMLFKILPA